MKKTTLLILLFFLGFSTSFNATTLSNNYYQSTSPVKQKEADVRHYFNNETKMLSLYTNTKLNEVVIYDIIGQEAFRKRLTNIRYHINLSELKKGVYIARVNGQNVTKTIRIVIK